MTGGDLTGYAHYVAGVPHALDVSFKPEPSEERGFGYYPGMMHKASQELVAVAVTSVYTIRGEEFPKFIVQDYNFNDPISKDEF